ncbi:MAG TPA: hypothetical protein P5532_22775 [Planctomycetota bacterium]|nr:hypothetical protein [Planctomycetota bacterium]HRT97251.1 hypothetical protein [Planctomycetota bacterium]
MLHILDRLAVREAVRRQPRRLRAVCYLLMDGYTLPEVAAALGRSRGTVRWQMSEIRKSFIRMGFMPFRRLGRRARRKKLEK